MPADFQNLHNKSFILKTKILFYLNYAAVN